jgi:hypothetical protein
LRNAPDVPIAAATDVWPAAAANVRRITGSAVVNQATTAVGGRTTVCIQAIAGFRHATGIDSVGTGAAQTRSPAATILGISAIPTFDDAATAVTDRPAFSSQIFTGRWHAAAFATALTRHASTPATLWCRTGTAIDDVSTSIQLLPTANVQLFARGRDAVESRTPIIIATQIARVLEDHPSSVFGLTAVAAWPIAGVSQLTGWFATLDSRIFPSAACCSDGNATYGREKQAEKARTKLSQFYTSNKSFSDAKQLSLRAEAARHDFA